jgi:hypothetical protein
MKQLRLAILLVIVMITTLTATGLVRSDTAQALSGANWSAGRIIDDQIFNNSQAISVSQIQAFLNAKVPNCDTNGTQSSSHWYSAGNRYYTRAEWGALSGSPAPFICLKDYVENLSTGQSNLSNATAPVPGGLSAAQIIAGASSQYTINPEVLIVLLQKEQSLVTDDWPWATQYKKATGAYCPDTAACDVSHAGFGNQVYSAARLLRGYINNPGAYNYAPGTNSILYNPNAGCGRSTVHVETRATAALYNYTPYQPNAAALANLYGTGDSCSAYGNRNFWRMFNDWFGSTTGSVTIVKKENDATLYFRDKNTIRPIPSMAVLEAWGFTGDMVSTLDATTFNTLTLVGPNLSQVVKVNGSSDVFFIDSGHHYYVRPESVPVWGFSVDGALALPAETIQATLGAGNLGNNITANADNGSVYAVDGTQKRAFTSLDAYNSWTGGFGGITKVSDAYFNSLAAGSAISTNVFAYNSTPYLIDGAIKHKFAGSSSGLAPAAQTTMSDRLFYFYFSGSDMSYLLRSPAGGVYLLDDGVKLPIGSLDVANSWRPSGSYLNLSDSALRLLATGSLWTKNVVRANDSTVYLIDQKKFAMTADVLEGYTGGTLPPIVSDALLASIPSGAQPASDFVKSASDSTIYILDYGKKRPITSFSSYQALNGARNKTLQSISDSALNLLPTGANIASSFLKSDNGGISFDNGAYSTLSSVAAAQWGLKSQTPLTDSTLGRYTNNGALTNKIRSGNTYATLYQGIMYRTNSANIAGLWGMDNTTTVAVGSGLIDSFEGKVVGLSQFARNGDRPNDGTIYLVDDGHFIPIASGDLFVGLGANNASVVSVPETFLQSLQLASERAKLGTITAGHTYVFDNGQKREVNSSFTAYWTSGAGANNFASYTLNLVGILGGNGASIKRVVRTNDGSMYVLENGLKRPIHAYGTYLTNFSSEGYSDISDSLARSIDTGQAY